MTDAPTEACPEDDPAVALSGPVVVIGAGAVGARAARQLLALVPTAELVVVDQNAGRAEALCQSLGPAARVAASTEHAMVGAAAAVVAAPHQALPAAERALEAGAHVVSAVDAMDDVKALLGLDSEARERGLHVVVGAGFSPGLSCLLARHAAAGFEHVEEIHVARAGTGGPSCARQHHAALGSGALDWRDGAWLRRPGWSGRELLWFPDPIGGQDCYRAALADALLLVPAFPGVRRVTARMAASRRDRITAWLPMLRPPHPEGLLGATRVEVRGRRGLSRDVQILGAIDRPAVAAATVAALAAVWAVSGRFSRTGAAGLAELVQAPGAFLRELAGRGVRAAVFEGASGQPGAMATA